MTRDADLKTKIVQIKSDMEGLVKPYCRERFSVDWYGAYDINPKHLVFWICVQSDSMKKELTDDDPLNKALREVLSKNDYPQESRGNVYIGFESQETVNRESNGNWYYHFK